MRLVNVWLVVWFMHGEFSCSDAEQKERFGGYLTRCVKTVGSVCALSVVRLKALNVLRCGAFNFGALKAPLNGPRPLHRLFMMSYLSVLEDVLVFSLSTYITVVVIHGLSYESMAALSLSAFNLFADAVRFLLYCCVRESNLPDAMKEPFFGPPAQSVARDGIEL
jgi:hypothetical protein